MPLIEPVQNVPFKKSILGDLEIKANLASHDYENLQIDKPGVIPTLMIKKGEVSSPSSYVSFFV